MYEAVDWIMAVSCNAILNVELTSGGPGSSVIIATGYGLDGTGIESPAGARFSTPVQTGLGPTQPPVQWYRVFPGGRKSRGVTLTLHPLLLPRSKTE
jgi:hypothetical protein